MSKTKTEPVENTESNNNVCNRAGRMPSVFADFVTAVSESDGDTRPLWETVVRVSPESEKTWWVRATTANQARQSVLSTVASPTRMTAQEVMHRLIAETQRLRADRNAEGADDTGTDHE